MSPTPRPWFATVRAGPVADLPWSVAGVYAPALVERKTCSVQILRAATVLRSVAGVYAPALVERGVCRSYEGTLVYAPVVEA